jgi:CheY-like chemotaxis protein
MKTILLLEDDQLLGEIFTELIESAGLASVEAVQDPFEAYCAALTRPFDLLICDYATPYVDGLTFLRMLRHKPTPNRTTSAILMSGYTQQTLPPLNLDGLIYVAKPPQFDELLDLIQTLLNGQTTPLPRASTDGC